MPVEPESLADYTKVTSAARSLLKTYVINRRAQTRQRRLQGPPIDFILHREIIGCLFGHRQISTVYPFLFLPILVSPRCKFHVR